MSGKGAYYKNLYGRGGARHKLPGSLHYGSIQKHSPPQATRSSRLFEDLAPEARRHEGRSYPAYRELTGCWESEPFTFFLDYVQSDPYARPSKSRVRVYHQHAQFPTDLFEKHVRKVALCDFLTRSICRAISSGVNVLSQSKEWAGAKGGEVTMDDPGQHVLQRTSVLIHDSFMEARFTMTLPARGRTILGHHAAHMIETHVPRIAALLVYETHDKNALKAFIDCIEDQEVLRDLIVREDNTELPLELAAFVANGSILPRSSGVSDSPMPAEQAVAFQSPPHLERTFQLPHRGKITGMGIPTGITLIAGGGFHGKSTLLDALSNGCYNKIPGDGREFVVTSFQAVAIRGEDGRSVRNVDISPFINNLPRNKSTDSFSTEDASGSTSMAAGVIEALELGADTLLLDEDTCATNFLIRDRRMQLLIAPEHEPITPLIFKIRSLYRDHGCSTILVVGGCGVFCDVADLVLQMRDYRCVDITERARQIADEIPSGVLETEESKKFGILRSRPGIPDLLSPSGENFIARGIRRIQQGEGALDLQGLTQLVHPSQTNTIAAFLNFLRTRRKDGNVPLNAVARILDEVCDGEYGLDVVSDGEHVDAFLARLRAIDVGMAINRIVSTV